MDTKLTASLEDLEKFFGSRMQAYEAKLEKATSGSTLLPDIAAIASEFSEFKLFVCQALSKLKTQIELLAAGFDRHETAMRRKVLLFHGIPEKPNEDLPDVVYNILSNHFKLTELSKDGNVIHVCHRLGFSQQKARPILVRFFKMENRQLVWESKKALKGTGITISEFLTQARHRVFMAARKHFGMLNCWSVEGRIVVICPDKSRRKIETAGELHDLVAKFPSSTVDTVSAAQVEEPGSSVATTLAASTKNVRKTRVRK
ncbi:hypothetical protein PYW07_002555 [Mythimna separata]|uniref:Uncharacterized protein n=1 Tax=Mythimna separata TaxID=271217 RepID=A0AAD7YFH9_MYTSE|nr:hypothetical protein PYW07_002555 [Mythimna separata]